MCFLLAPHGDALTSRLFGTGFDFHGRGAQWMIDNNRRKIAHAGRVALHLGFVKELGGDDDRRRAT